MIRVLPVILALWLAASPAFAASSSPSPTPDPVALFAAERAAAGGDIAGAAEIVERGTYHGSGATGSYVTYTDPRTGYTKSVVTIAGTTQAQGYDAAGAWSAQGGLVEPLEDAASTASARTAAYVARNGWWSPGTDPATFTYVGQKAGTSGEYDVVRVAPAGGDAIEVWLDTQTHLAGKTVETNASNVTTVTTYGDYRGKAGAAYPWSTDIADGNPADDQQLRVTSVRFLTSLDQVERVAARRPQNTRTGSIAGGTSTTIPFDLDDPGKGHIVILVRVNGSRPLHVIFDTGGSNIVTPSVAREIGLKGSGSLSAGGAGEGQVTIQVASGAKLQLGAATLTNQPFGIFPLPQSLIQITGRYRIDGVVGYEILKNFVVSIDYVKRTLTLTQPDAFAYSGGGSAIRFASATVPVIPVTFDGVHGSFMLDTGNAFYNTVSQPFLDAHGLASRPPNAVMAQTSGNIGGAIRPWLMRAKQIEIGPYRIARPVFAVTNTSKGALAGTTFSGNLSQAVISRFDVTLDYAHSVIYLKPNANFTKPFVGSLDGMSLYETNAGRLTVAYVNPGSPAAKAGIVAGDTILEAQHIPASKLGTADLSSLESAGTVLYLTFQSDGKTRRAALALGEIVP